MRAKQVSAVVLAAGANRRFAGPHSKLLSEWRGRTLIEHVLEAAANARLAKLVSEIVVVAPADAARLKSLAVAVECRVCHPPPDGPLSESLKAALAAIDPRADGIVILLGDQPLVTQRVIKALLDKAGASPRALARVHYSGVADPVSHPVYIGRDHFRLVHELEGDEGFRVATERLGLRWSEAWVEGDNPDVDHTFDLTRLK